MVRQLIDSLRIDLKTALGDGAGRTSLSPPGGALWLSHWSLACLVAGLTLLGACGYHAGFTRINDAATAYPDWVWQCLTTLGDERVPFALSLFIARHRPRIFWALILSALVAGAYSRGLKPLFDMPRPPAVLDPSQFNLIGPSHRRASFPSGHSVTAGVFFGVLTYYAPWAAPRMLLVLLAVLAGLSRVALGVHWPVDVAFGLFGGVLAAWAGTRLAARWPGPATNPSMHLAFVTLACFLTITLTYWDGGYSLARPMLAVLGWGALTYACINYLVIPTARAWFQIRDSDRRG